MTFNPQNLTSATLADAKYNDNMEYGIMFGLFVLVLCTSMTFCIDFACWRQFCAKLRCCRQEDKNSLARLKLIENGESF